MTQSRQLALFVAALLFIAASATAQPTFPGSGLLGPGGPAIVDNDGNGPDDDDPEIWPRWHERENGIALIVSDCEGMVYGQEGSGPPGIFDRFGINSNTYPLVITSYSNGFPVAAMYDDGGSTGSLTLQPGSDGLYDTIVINSTKFGQLIFQLMTTDVDNDGMHDYVNAGPLGTLGLEDCLPFSADDPVNVPIAERPECGLPEGARTVVLDLDGDGALDEEFLCGPPIWAAMAIPTTGNLGLLFLSLLVIGVALYALRALG
jgi:hypothetical protein